jgi:hypothetical protein
MMRTRIAILACAAVLTLSGLAQAAQSATIATPMIFGTGEQDRADCLVLNGGTTPGTVALRIVDDFGQTVATSSCSGPLGAGQFCALRTPIDNAEAHACIATVEGATTNLRGTLVLEEKLTDPIWGTFFYRPVRSAPMR